MIKAVVFDWDGTLVDNMGIHATSFREALKGIVDIEPEDIYLREGGRAIDIIRDLAKGASEDEIQKAWKDKGKIYERLSRGISMLPEGRELIAKLRRNGTRIGLATGARRKSLHIVMDQNETGLFDYIVTGDDTSRAKPDPEPYLKCLMGLGIRPEDSIAVDNAPMGVRSAKAAGMACIAITSTLPREYFKGADFVVKNIEEAGETLHTQTHL